MKGKEKQQNVELLEEMAPLFIADLSFNGLCLLSGVPGFSWFVWFPLPMA